jgi:hypothetical protein
MPIKCRAIPEQQPCDINEPLVSCDVERRGAIVPRVNVSAASEKQLSDSVTVGKYSNVQRE